MREEIAGEIEVEVVWRWRRDVITVEIPWWAVYDFEAHRIVMKAADDWAEENGCDLDELEVSYEELEVEDRRYWIIVSNGGGDLTDVIYRLSEDAAYAMGELAGEMFTRDKGFAWRLDMDEHELTVFKVEENGEAYTWITYEVMELTPRELPAYQDYDLVS